MRNKYCSIFKGVGGDVPVNIIIISESIPTLTQTHKSNKIQRKKTKTILCVLFLFAGFLMKEKLLNDERITVISSVSEYQQVYLKKSSFPD